MTEDNKPVSQSFGEQVKTNLKVKAVVLLVIAAFFALIYFIFVAMS